MDVTALIKRHEGFTPIAKPDAKGKWEYGYGFDIDPPQPGQSAPSITREEADKQFPAYLATATAGALNAIGGWWPDLDEVRQAVLIDMAYELGAHGLAKFRLMLAAVRLGDWPMAKEQALDSDWAKQVPHRAEEDAEMLLTGEWPA